MLKQIDCKEALELMAKGTTINVLVPTTPEPQSWTDYNTDTLDRMLEDCLFFGEAPEGETEGTKGEDGQKDKSVKKAVPKPAKVDAGKLYALHHAGWSGKAIADELKVSESTVSAYLKRIKVASVEAKDEQKQ